MTASADLSSLKIITYGSEPMDPRTLALLNERFPGCRISQKYGTTETGSPRSASRANDSLWLKLGGDGVEMKVVDGVLHLRSESTILGYLNAPSPVDAEGWYCTGDLVEVDGEWIRFRGQKQRPDQRRWREGCARRRSSRCCSNSISSVKPWFPERPTRSWGKSSRPGSCWPRPSTNGMPCDASASTAGHALRRT